MSFFQTNSGFDLDEDFANILNSQKSEHAKASSILYVY